jgi:hypothetical protein
LCTLEYRNTCSINYDLYQIDWQINRRRKLGSFSAKTAISQVLDIKDDNFFLLNNDYAFVGTIVDDDGIIDEFGSS